MIGFLFELARTIRILWRRGNNWLRVAIVVSIAWPIAISLISLYGSSFTTSMVALALLIALVGLFTFRYDPLWIAVVDELPFGYGEKALRALKLWIGIGILTAVFFSVIPAASNPKLIPLFFLALILASPLLLRGGFERVEKFGLIVCAVIVAMWVFGAAKGTFTAKMPETTVVAHHAVEGFDGKVATRFKAWLEATPTPTPKATPSVSALPITPPGSMDELVAHARKCPEEVLHAEYRPDFDEAIPIKHYDCWHTIVVFPLGKAIPWTIDPGPGGIIWARYVYTWDGHTGPILSSAASRDADLGEGPESSATFQWYVSSSSPPSGDEVRLIFWPPK